MLGQHKKRRISFAGGETGSVRLYVELLHRQDIRRFLCGHNIISILDIRGKISAFTMKAISIIPVLIFIQLIKN